ncbi:hypothetical protein HOF56_04870 [Candidatus Peribacteria bacterium]|jgi:hypothetical protein|nr:hypothetical protein [Candidatus Peribacteria bacterium]MBT4021477.1 hypothetical protein [Candidatus Peribacteria bacterium]MBT4240387.1 hypothetical protein [Candidatus Peribacteria bacterium]MBT4473810.1 hypothetical protein [Candidatus Peribacteria bacterium]
METAEFPPTAYPEAPPTPVVESPHERAIKDLQAESQRRALESIEAPESVATHTIRDQRTQFHERILAA